MKHLFLGILCLILAAPAWGSLPHKKKRHHHHHVIPANLEMWCGAPTGLERERFPYLAAIHDYRTRSGAVTQTATIYKKGRVLMREFVSRVVRKDQLSFEDSTDSFALTFNTKDPKEASFAGLKAFVRDEDGDKLIDNGSIPCFKVHNS